MERVEICYDLSDVEASSRSRMACACVSRPLCASLLAYGGRRLLKSRTCQPQAWVAFRQLNWVHASCFARPTIAARLPVLLELWVENPSDTPLEDLRLSVSADPAIFGARK